MLNNDRQRQVFIAFVITAAIATSLLHLHVNDVSILDPSHVENAFPPPSVAAPSKLNSSPVQRPTRNVILTSIALSPTSFNAAILNLDTEAEAIIRQFAGSYRRINGTADILIISNVEAPATAREGLSKHNIIWLLMDRQAYTADDGRVIDFGNVLRHNWFRHVLQNLFPGRYDRVLVADSRDVYFQVDPFKTDEFADLTFTLEEALVQPGDWFYDRSLGSGYTFAETAQYKGHMICAGVFLGKTEPMLLFFRELVAEALKRNWTQTDQHYIFHIVRQRKLQNLSIKLSPALEIAWHLKKKTPPTPEFFVNSKGLITDKEGNVIPILHHIHYPQAMYLNRYLVRYSPPFEPSPDLAGIRTFSPTGKSRPAVRQAKADP